MALFKVFRGPKEEFSEDFSKVPFHDGYAYFVNDTGLFYIDYVSNTGSQIRRCLNAGTASQLDNGEEVLDVDDINDMIDKATTTTYNISIAKNAWTINSSGGYKYTYTNTALKCGKNGQVPPIVTCRNNQSDYDKITSGDATAGNGITFYISQMPSAAIDLTIIDNA